MPEIFWCNLFFSVLVGNSVMRLLWLNHWLNGKKVQGTRAQSALQNKLWAILDLKLLWIISNITLNMDSNITSLKNL